MNVAGLVVHSVCLKKPYWTPVIESGPVADAYRNNPAPLALYKMNGTWTQQEQLKSIYYHVKGLNYTGNPTTLPGVDAAEGLGVA